MTKTIDELYKDWVDARAAYHGAVTECYWSAPSDRNCEAVDRSRHAMDIAWANYDAAFNAYLDAKYDADGKRKVTP